MYIIAEAGINHNGSIERALEMVEAAYSCGCQAVKFQAAIPKLVCVGNAPLADYQTQDDFDSQIDMLENYHLPLDAYITLAKRSRELGIDFLCSCFDLESLKIINKIGVKYHKIPSGEIFHYPLVTEIAKSGKPVILSTGMASIEEIHIAVNCLEDNGCPIENITIMHCTTSYPTQPYDVNMNILRKIKTSFPKASLGYSDHTIGCTASILACGFDATCFEKHFTLDKSLDGPDHKASLSITELAAYVNELKNAMHMLGNDYRELSFDEANNKKTVRRSIYALAEIKKGESFTDKNLVCLRPDININSLMWPDFLGKISKFDYLPGQPINEQQ